MNHNDISNLAYSLWIQAGKPDDRSNHFWRLASDQLDQAGLQISNRDPTISEFNKRVNSENSSGFRSDRLHIERVFDQAAKTAFGTVPTFPTDGMLWHYTTGSTVASIVQRGEIWSTRLDCLNDSSEYQLAFRLLSEVLSLRPLTSTSSNESSFQNYLNRRFSERPRYYENCFISCFSTERNDLSQWRAYGGSQGENGFAIGFDAHALIEYNRSLSLQKVTYDEECLRRYLSIVIEGLFSFYLTGSKWNADRESLREAWEDITYTHFERAAVKRFTSFKDEAFISENEWRLVNWTAPTREKLFQFTQGGSMLRQHLPIPASIIGYNDRLLPIREVLVGPSRHAQISKTTVENLLSSNGYSSGALGWDIKVSISNTPFQTI